MTGPLLAIDTSTSAISAAIVMGDRVLAEDALVDARRHTEGLAPIIESVLRQAHLELSSLTAIAVGVGPGPFTGLRVGIVTATTLGFALGIPVLGVCSLDALAEAYAAPGDFIVATDARRKEVYWARYRRDGGVAQRLTEPAVSRPADLPADVRALPTVGRGSRIYPDLLPNAAGPLDVSAGALGLLTVRLRNSQVALPVAPLYLRRPDAHEPGTPKPALTDEDRSWVR